MDKYKLACDFLRNHIFKADSEVFCKFLDYKLAEASEIHTAALNNNVSEIDSLLSQNININSTDHLGRTPLHLAVFHSCEDAIRLLLEKGTKAEIKDNFGLTPLQYAEEKGNREIFELLLNNPLKDSVVPRSNFSTKSVEAEQQRGKKCLIM